MNDFFRRMEPSTWLTLAVFAVGFIMTWVQFKTHVADFEELAKSRFDRIDQAISTLQQYERTNAENIVRLETSQADIARRLDKVEGIVIK